MMKDVFKISKVFFRLLSTWLIVFGLFCLKSKDSFTSIEFANDSSLLSILIVFTLVFMILSIISYFIKKDNFEYIMSLVLYLVCSIYWTNIISNIFFIPTLFLLFILIWKYKLKNLKIKVKLNNKITTILMILSALTMFVTTAIVTIFRYKTFSSANFDLGIPTQNFYYLKKLLIPYSTSERNYFLSHFAVHISPIYYLILPIYIIFPSAVTLQIVAALLIASGMIPIYLIAKHKKFPNYGIVLLCFLYAIYAPAICSTFYDFHENTFLTPLLLWLFYFYEKSKRKWYYLILILVLFVKEDAPLYIIIFGIYEFFDNNKKLGAKTTLIGLTYFVIINTILTTYGEGPMSFRYSNLIYNDSGMIGAIKTILVNPGYFLNQLTISDSMESINKIKYLIYVFLPLGFLPFKCKQWKNYILLLPLLLTIMTTYEYNYDINFHYSNGVVAFVLYLFIINLHDFKIYNYLAICIFGSILVYTSCVYSQIRQYLTYYIDEKDDFVAMEKVLKKIPANASVNASSFIVAHIANRDTIYDSFYHNAEPDIEFVVLGKECDIGDFETNYNSYIHNNYYEYDKYKNKLIILKKD